MSDGREERQQQEQRRRDAEQQLRNDSPHSDRRRHPDSYQDRLDRFPADPFHPERPDS